MKTTLLLLTSVLGLTAAACYELRDDGHRRNYRCLPADGPEGPAEPPTGSCGSCPVGEDVLYVSRDGLACAAIPFDCGVGERRFDSACGCGCRPEEDAPVDGGGVEDCPDETAADVLYLSVEAKVCEGVSFSCGEGEERFDSPCGCGCRAACPAAADPRVHYLSSERAVCERIEFSCPADCVAFDDRCGCGCIEPVAGAACPAEDEALYVSTSTTICSRVELRCGSGEEVFDDACGCGCLPSL
ncbi:MAG: hypothetical protein AAGD10_16335 [Myxococcota bacterium]